MLMEWPNSTWNDGMSIWIPHGMGIDSTWSPHGVYIDFPHGVHIDFPHGFSTWSPHGVYIDFPHGVHIESTWSPRRFHIYSIWNNQIRIHINTINWFLIAF